MASGYNQWMYCEFDSKNAKTIAFEWISDRKEKKCKELSKIMANKE